MKGALIALVLALALAIPVAASAQDWVMDWHSTGQGLFATWDLSGSSTATLTLRSDIGATDFSKIYHPDGPVYELRYTNQGRPYGGLVAQGTFQEQGNFTIPAAGQGNGNTLGESEFGAGHFNVMGGTFTADINVGMGHETGHWTATGRLASVTTAAEPTVLLLSGVGLVGAAMLRRSRRG